MTNSVITAHVPVDKAEKIDELAANADRSRGRIVKQALAAIIEQDGTVIKSSGKA
ncbi:ribbon-helix-helix domain-containing protein [Serratia fonticola]